MKKKMDNKGFSLVELIVVVAIMAVLLVVLAPQYTRYVERTRLQKDNSAIAEVANAIKIAMADEAVNSAVVGSFSMTTNADANNHKKFEFLAADATGGNALTGELRNIIGEDLETQSDSYRTPATAIVITVTKAGSGNVTVTVVGWLETVGGTASTTANPKEL